MVFVFIDVFLKEQNEENVAAVLLVVYIVVLVDVN